MYVYMHKQNVFTYPLQYINTVHIVLCLAFFNLCLGVHCISVHKEFSLRAVWFYFKWMNHILFNLVSFLCFTVTNIAVADIFVHASFLREANVSGDKNSKVGSLGQTLCVFLILIDIARFPSLEPLPVYSPTSTV